MGKKGEHKVNDAQLFLLMVEELGMQRSLQVLGYALLALMSGARDLDQFRRMVQKRGLYCDASIDNMHRDVRKVRQVWTQAEGGDPGTVWEILGRMGRMRAADLLEIPKEGLTPEGLTT